MAREKNRSIAKRVFSLALHGHDSEDIAAKSMWNITKNAHSWNSSTARKLFWRSHSRKHLRSLLFSEKAKEKGPLPVKDVPPSPRSPLDSRSFNSKLARSTESSHINEDDASVLMQVNFVESPFERSRLQDEFSICSSILSRKNSLNLDVNTFQDNQDCDLDGDETDCVYRTLNSFHSGFLGIEDGTNAVVDAHVEETFSYLPQDKQRSLYGQYKLVEILGQGSYGTVYTCSSLQSQEKLACKFISKSNMLQKTTSFLQKKTLASQSPSEFCWKAVHLEISAMQMLNNHPNVVQIKEVFEDSNFIQILIERCNGGDLSEEVEKRGHLPEEDAIQVFHGLIQALAHCHSRGVLHLDIKMENLLLNKLTPSIRGGTPRLEAKLADFGKSAIVANGDTVEGAVGSIAYMAPEVLSGKRYNSSADVWSAGICFYVMLCGRFPWEDSSKSKRPEFYGPAWRRVSIKSKVLIRKMLCFDPAKRPSAAEVLKHCLFKQMKSNKRCELLSWN